WQSHLPGGEFLPLSYLAGSWIGGGANAIAVQKAFNVTDVSAIIVVDVAVANVWMACLLYFASRPQRLDRWLGGDTRSVQELERRMESYQAAVARQPSVSDLIVILAMAFGAAYVADALSLKMVTIEPFAGM